jgi:ABC-2 type transport system permease protein
VPLPVATLPGMVALMVVSGGIIDVAGVLSTEREDGTLLRAKAVPNGIVGYLTARVVQSSLNVVAGALAILVLGLAVVPDLLGVPAARWLVLLGLIVFGLLATLPWGAVIGAVARTPATVFGLGMVPVMAVTAVSGVFYPITALPGWAQAVGQAFPMYWLGLGARAAVLPEAAVAAELGGSWRTGPTLAVLGVWAVAGLVLAPGLLRRMARRESGTNLQERRDQAMQRYS